MLARPLVRTSFVGLVLSIAVAGAPACTGPDEAEADRDADSSTASASAAELELGDVASASSESTSAQRLIARAVLGMTRMRDERGRKRFLVQVRYFDADGALVAVGIPRATDAPRGRDLALVRMRGSEAIDPGAEAEQLRAEANAINERLLTDVEAHGCAFGKGFVRSVSRAIGGLVLTVVGVPLFVGLLPVILVTAGTADPLDFLSWPAETGIRLLKGSFRPCSELPELDLFLPP